MMKAKVILYLIFCFLSFSINAQEIDISNTTTTDNAVEFSVVSPNNNTGVIVPIMTTAQMNAIASPTNGLLIYNSDLGKFMYYTVAQWTFVGEIPSVADNAALTALSGMLPGDMRYDRTAKHIYFYNGSTWVALSDVAGP